MSEPELLLPGDPDYNQQVELWRAWRQQRDLPDSAERDHEMTEAFRSYIWQVVMPDWIHEAMAEQAAQDIQPAAWVKKGTRL